MRPKTYHVTLTTEQREELTHQSTSHRRSARERKRARILLLADEARVGGAVADKEIAAQIKVCLPTVGRVRQRFALAGQSGHNGSVAAVHRKEQQKRKALLLDGAGEAHLIALTCSAPPAGRQRWSLHLLRDTLIEQQIVASISHETVRQTLKKINLNPG